MKRYHFRFIGRPKGSIGILRELTACREAETAELARVQLYDEFEHITVLAVKVAPWRS